MSLFGINGYFVIQCSKIYSELVIFLVNYLCPFGNNGRSGEICICEDRNKMVSVNIGNALGGHIINVYNAVPAPVNFLDNTAFDAVNFCENFRISVNIFKLFTGDGRAAVFMINCSVFRFVIFAVKPVRLE